jgi:hypothetical protein
MKKLLIDLKPLVTDKAPLKTSILAKLKVTD